MSDPLKILREYVLESKQIREKDDLIVFGDIAFKKNAKTNFKIYSIDPGKPTEYYTLESLHFFIQKKDLQHGAYVKEAAKKELQPVSRPDRKDLERYLTSRDGKVPTSIDITAPIPPPIPMSRVHHSERQNSSHAHPEGRDGHDSAKKARLDNAANMQKEKDRINRLLNDNLRPQPDNNFRALSKDLTADKVKKLRTKMITMKRGRIQKTDDELIPGVGAGDSLDSEGLDRELRNRERVWRTRTTCMEASGKNFAKGIFPILSSLKAREEAKNSDQNHTKPDPVSAVPKPRVAQQPGYSRYDQEIFRKEETGDFKIDTIGSYHGITLKSITEGAKPKPSTTNPAKTDSTQSTPQKRVSRTPIIIIPATPNSLITMYNVRDLLQDLKFVSTEEKKSKGFRRDSEVLIHRQKDGGITVPFRVIDNPLKLSTEEWDRVVAVFVQGPAWQFKGWPWNGNPVEIFTKISAFHLKWDDMKVDGNVGKWNVGVLALSKTKRHLDRANLHRFWGMLDKYMVKHKGHLRF